MDLKIMPVEQCGQVNKCQSSPGGYASDLKSRYSYSDPTPARVAVHALQQLEAARQRDIEMHEKNLPAMANNKVIADHIHALMAAIGMPKNYKIRDFKSRARYPKWDHPAAGYLGDISREIKTDDGFVPATHSYEHMLGTYRQFKEQADRLEKQAEEHRQQAAERERQARLANIELAEIILRYGIDRESDWKAVLGHLRGLHQRADLAVAMLNVRRDWSDGPDEVSNAIDRFNIETTEDKDIANSVMNNLGDGWGGDGRCFRDCAWNYDRLLASLPEQLAADIGTAFNQVTIND